MFFRILSTALAVFESSTSTTTTSANPLKRTTTDSTASTTTAAAAAAVDSTLADGTQRKRTKMYLFIMADSGF